MLIHFMPLISFDTPWKHQKTFSGGIDLSPSPSPTLSLSPSLPLSPSLSLSLPLSPSLSFLLQGSEYASTEYYLIKRSVK